MNEIIDQIKTSLSKISGFMKDDIVIDIPDMRFGDFSSNLAMTFKGDKKAKAEEYKRELEKDKDLIKFISKIEIAGSGFINFWLKDDVLVDILEQIVTLKEEYGKANIGEGKSVVIDYSAPNIAKRFSIGHLRSTIIGQALYNLYGKLGYKVIGDNHLGDWGTQFGKLLYMIDKHKIDVFDIEKLEDLYVEFHKLAEDDKEGKMEEEARRWFKKLEDGDSKALDIWQKCKNVSMEEFNRIYKLLGVSFDVIYGESFYQGVMKEMMKDEKITKHLVVGEGGSLIVDLTEHKISTPLMFVKSDGTTTYATRDLATLYFRQKTWDPDIVIYEVGAEQSLYFAQVFASAKKMGIIKKDTILYHVRHGLYLASNGRKFSTRKGETIKLEEILQEAIKRAEKIGCKDNKTAEKVGIGAIKYFDLSHSPSSNIVFNWENIFRMEGNSGPYIQYTYARARSVIRKGKTGKPANQKLGKDESIVIRTLSKYPLVIQKSALAYSPNILSDYLFDLSQKFNSFYAKQKIIGSENQDLRLNLTKAVSMVIKDGLNNLGIESPESM